MRAIVQLFTKSPFGALKQHMLKGGECVGQVRSMFEAMLDGDDARLASIAKQISKTEHRADEIKNEIRDNLPRSIFLPVDRADFLSVLSQQDSIPDTVEDIAVLLTVRKTFVPPSWRELLLGYVDKCVETFRAAAEVVTHLDELVDVGLTGPDAEEMVRRSTASASWSGRPTRPSSTCSTRCSRWRSSSSPWIFSGGPRSSARWATSPTTRRRRRTASA